jgi:hypothetical protein
MAMLTANSIDLASTHLTSVKNVNITDRKDFKARLTPE